MTTQNFNRPGAMDLSSLTQAAAASSAPAASGGAAGAGAYVVEVTDANFDAVMRQSAQFPVIVEFTSPRARAEQLSADLTKLSDEAHGAWLLARIDIDKDAGIAQELGIQAVPMVVAVIGGQMAPLFQGTKSIDDIRPYLDQVLKVAVANGLTGKAKPAATAAPAEKKDDAAPAADPRFAAADAALSAGDYAKAVEEFNTVLAASPGDAEAIAGRAQAALLQRSSAVDPVALKAKSADTSDVQTQLDLADQEVLSGNPDAAFTRLLALIRATHDDEREQVRLRLLDLFETVGRSDPSVLKARRGLSTALF